MIFNLKELVTEFLKDIIKKEGACYETFNSNSFSH
jgi:hypothetical protein